MTSLLLLLLYFTNNSKNSPGFEHLLEKAGRATFAVQGKIKKMGNIVPELMNEGKIKKMDNIVSELD